MIQETRSRKGGPTAGEKSGPTAGNKSNHSGKERTHSWQEKAEPTASKNSHFIVRDEGDCRGTNDSINATDKAVDVPVTMQHQMPTIQTAQKRRVRVAQQVQCQRSWMPMCHRSRRSILPSLNQMSSEVAELDTDLGAQSAQLQRWTRCALMSRRSLPRQRRISDKSLQTSLW